jgi:hypothetical protein
MLFDPLYILIALPGFILALVAQAKVKTTYAETSRIRSRRGVTGAEVAREILRENEIHDVRVEPTEGLLTDHYHPVEKALRLSSKNFHGDSLAAIGVSAHEVGHALQHHQGYFPLVIRSALVPVCSFGSNFAYILFIIGLFLSAAPLGSFLMKAAILLFSGAVLFTLITLPVEFNASSRALAILSESGIVSRDELVHVRKVLNAAALTYVAAAVQALLVLLWMIVRARE